MDVDDQVEHKRARDGAADSSSEEQEQQQVRQAGLLLTCGRDRRARRVGWGEMLGCRIYPCMRVCCLH